MCLVLENNKKKYIANQDKKVYKVLISVKSYLISPVMHYIYKFNVLNFLHRPLKLTTKNNKIYIEEGYYSFKYEPDAIDYACNCFTHLKTYIVECIIPKDSEYCIEDGIIVSNQLVIKNIIAYA